MCPSGFSLNILIFTKFMYTHRYTEINRIGTEVYCLLAQWIQSMFRLQCIRFFIQRITIFFGYKTGCLTLRMTPNNYLSVMKFCFKMFFFFFQNNPKNLDPSYMMKNVNGYSFRRSNSVICSLLPFSMGVNS